MSVVARYTTNSTQPMNNHTHNIDPFTTIHDDCRKSLSILSVLVLALYSWHLACLYEIAFYSCQTFALYLWYVCRKSLSILSVLAFALYVFLV